MDSEVAAFEYRRHKVAGAVWGFTLMTLAALFLLDSFGTLDLGERARYSASRALDGDPGTRWSSSFSDPQWIAVDLGARVDIARVRLSWEAAYAKAYQIQVSDDAVRWTTVLDVQEGQGGVEVRDVDAHGRYLRVLGTRRATPWGYSLRELQVFGREGELLSQGKTATASSRERVGPWLLLWPALLLAMGLPAVIAPRSSGNQVLGVLLAGAGIFLLLRTLGLLPWGLGGSAAVVLLATGALLIAQALRGGRASTASGGPDGSTRG